MKEDIKNIKYLCGNCLSIDEYNKKGYCTVCDTDMWIEKTDFKYGLDWIAMIAQSLSMSVMFLESFFSYDSINKLENNTTFYREGISYSYPYSCFIKGINYVC